MKQQQRELSRESVELNSAVPVAFIAGIRAFVASQIRSASAKEDLPPLMVAPIGNRRANGSAGPMPLVDATAEGAREALPAVEQQQLLDPGVILPPIGLPEEVVPAETIACAVQFRLVLTAEGKGAPSYCFSDRDPDEKFCRLLVAALNVDSPPVRSALAKRNVGTIRFFAGVALVKYLLRDHRSALVETLLAKVKTRAGIAPNARLSTAAFARRLAESALLAPVADLPIFGSLFPSAIGRSFPLAEIDVAIPVEDLGAPWNRPSKRKDPPNYGTKLR